MAEWGDLDARLERKKRVKLRRQQREMKKQHAEMELLEKERRKLMLRCEEMAREEQLSIAMMRFYRQQENLRRREIQREKDMDLYEQVAKVRRRAKQLGLPLSTPRMSGIERLEELQTRVATRETSLEVAAKAKQRLDALPKKRSRVRRILESYFSSSLTKKVEQAVYEQHCESLLALLEPTIPGRQAIPSLLNHESKNGMTPVLCAIFQRKLSLLRRLLELGASPDFETSTGLTPLLASVMIDDDVAVSILVENRANLAYETHTGVTVSLLAADMGRNSVLKTLVRHGADHNTANATGRTPLIQAVVSRHYDTVQILLAFGARKDYVDKAGRTALDWARRSNAGNIASLLASSITSKDLMSALQEREEEEADAPNGLVQQAVRQQNKSRGTLAMESALRDGNVGRILELLSVEDVGYGPNYESSTGETPLLAIAAKGSLQQVLSGLEHKSIATQCNRFGVNALMKAAYNADVGVLEALIQAGCSLWSRDFKGNDAFRYLNDNEHPDVVAQLMKRHHRRDPPRLTLGVPVENVDAVRETSYTRPLPHAVDERQGSEEDLSPSDDSESDSKDITDDAEEDDLYHEQIKSHKWSLRRRVLRESTKRNESFEVERDKVRAYALYGRRHGLVAPLPHDPAGRFKYPPCDNCQSNRARKRCFLCDQVLCDKCQARLHELPHRRHHEYEELEPTLVVGAKPVEVLAANQRESLRGSVDRSMQCIKALKETLHAPLEPLQRVGDPEVDKYERKQRVIREKQISTMEINVPVAAAKHATRCGDGDIYSNPANIELADLYITQGKLVKARDVVEEAKRVIEESLGYAHPTMIKIHIRLARIEQHSGDLEKSISVLDRVLGTFESVLHPDHKDLVAAQELALQVLDGLGRYQAAVEVCRRVVRLRVVGLSSSHPLVHQLHHHLESFISKREKESMRLEDTRSLNQAAASAEDADNQRAERERHLQSFRSLLLESQPLAEYDAFLAYAKKEFAEDMVQFWIAVERAKTTINDHDAKAFRAAVVGIFQVYIKSRRIKLVTAVQRKKMKKAITTPGKKLSRTILDEVQTLVFEVIYSRVYPRFRDGLATS